MNLEKSHLRETVQAKLAMLSTSELQQKNYLLSSRLLNFLVQHKMQRKIIGAYNPFKLEPDWGVHFPHEMRVSFPVLEGEKMDYFYNGVNAEEPVIPEVLFIPGLAFSPKGERLGRGKGFFDRYLENHKEALKIGLCFEEQMMKSIPTQTWDKKMDFIITEKEIYQG